MSTPAPRKGRSAALSNWGRRARIVDSIPTVPEAKRRRATAGPDPWLTPEALEAFRQAEEEAAAGLLGQKSTGAVGAK